MKDKQKVMEVTPADDPNAVADEEEKGRETWDNQCEFFLSCLGYAVGFGNVWRFPYLAYKNGGAIFLIPYLIMLLVAGLPLFFMELALGQFSSLAPNKLFLFMSPIFQGVGWGMLMVSLLTTIYYNVILAWTLFYSFMSFTSELPWGSCDNYFNSKNCFTAALVANCSKQNLFYYDNDCLSVEDYCGVSNFSTYNASHCVVPLNETYSIEKSANSSITRISASEDFFKHRMLKMEPDTTWSNMGSLNWELVGCLFLAWVIVGACLIKGVKSSGKVVYFTAIFPYVVLVILFFRGITLEGAYDGIDFYIMRPNITKLGEVEVWADAATQIFYSLGAAFGGLIVLSSYNKFKNNCMRDAIIIAVANCSTSVFAGFVIFSFLGFMAHQQEGVSVQDLVTSGSGLAFIVYAEAVTSMPLPPLWSCLFFFMLITLGLDSQFTMVETLTTAMFDHWPVLRKRKPIVVTLMCFGLFLGGLTMVLQGGMYMFELFTYYSAGISVIVLALFEVVIVTYVYGFKKFMAHITDDMGIWVPLPLYYYWAATWHLLTPVSMFLILMISFYNFTPASFGDYLFEPSVQGLGWVLTFASIILIPLFAGYIYWTGEFKGKALIQNTEDFCPAHVRTRRERAGQKKMVQPDGTFKYIYDNDGYLEGVSKVYPPVSSIEMEDGKPSSNGYNGDALGHI